MCPSPRRPWPPSSVDSAALELMAPAVSALGSCPTTAPQMHRENIGIVLPALPPLCSVALDLRAFSKQALWCQRLAGVLLAKGVSTVFSGQNGPLRFLPGLL